MIRKRPLVLVAVICVMMAGFTMAQDADTTASSSTSSSNPNLGWRGWGVRVGLASGPDQALVGFHFDVGEFAKNVWFQPDVVMGFGDDTVSFVVSAPVWYRFELDGNITPYVGGAVAAGVFRVDDNNHTDTDFELGLQIGGGAEWRLRSGRRFLAELRLDVVDVWDLAVMAGWTF